MREVYGRSPAMDALALIKHLDWCRALQNRWELADLGLWPVPRGVTLWRKAPGVWEPLP
jgi:hypothetical protein